MSENELKLYFYQELQYFMIHLIHKCHVSFSLQITGLGYISEICHHNNVK